MTANKGDSNFYNPHDSFNPNVEDYVWKEQKTEIPPFPEDENLVEFQVTRPNASFSYFVDANSLSYTKADGIVRYTVVIKSKTGAKNVAFEGMRCSTKEFKTYAFGNGKGKFVKPRKYEWKSIMANNYTRYRKDLSDYYFCDIHMLDLSAEKILTEMRYGKTKVLEAGFR
ncbi:MAG: CNP1-like family protein [Sedimenticola sp.]|nr:CNP1-like family protein [Sedimenticola sp.]